MLAEEKSQLQFSSSAAKRSGIEVNMAVQTAVWLKTQLRQIDHKPYGMYKQLQGAVCDMGEYTLIMDHIQGDPFAAPSRLRISISPQIHGFTADLRDSHEKKTALEDLILRRFSAALRTDSEKGMGSGKSGNLTTCRVGQEVLERIAVLFQGDVLEVRFEAGFPARGRSILSNELQIILFNIIPAVVRKSLICRNLNIEDIRKSLELAENQKAVRRYIDENRLAAFVADGSVLPRESGVSDRPLKSAVRFSSPESLRVSIPVPHGKPLTGMGIPRGITVITGGGYHGKSTLLRALESGVYNHIAGDGREYVITSDDAVKIRAEDGRSVRHCDISAFINNLPGGNDTSDFSTDNASGSTSQAINVTEALEAGSRLLLIDEDTAATNFMIRDSLMARLVSDDEEPITPFIRKIRSLYEDRGVSTVLIAGSCGEYLAEADTVLRMNCYKAEDVTARAAELVRECGISPAVSGFPDESFYGVYDGYIEPDAKYHDYKIKTSGKDLITINHETVDVRYLEQICSEGQCVALGLMLRYIFLNTEPETLTRSELADFIYERIREGGLLAITPPGYSSGHPVMPRRQEFMGCLGRLRSKYSIRGITPASAGITPDKKHRSVDKSGSGRRMHQRQVCN